MSKLQSNIDELRKIIGEDNFKVDEAIEFLDAIEEDAIEMESETITSLQDEVTAAESRVDELLTEIANLEEEEPGTTIECGIGTIKYDADNLQLQELMEALEVRIKENGALKTLRMLQMPLPVS